MKISTTTAVFDTEIERVWEIVTNNAEWEWRSDLSKIEITGENTFTEFAKNGFPTRFTITEKKEHERYEFDMDNKNFSGHWTGIFRAGGRKTNGGDLYRTAARQKSRHARFGRRVYEYKKISARLHRRSARAAEK